MVADKVPVQRKEKYSLTLRNYTLHSERTGIISVRFKQIYNRYYQVGFGYTYFPNGFICVRISCA